MDGAIRQMPGCFEPERFEGERVVGEDMAFFLDEKQLVVGFVGRQEPHPFSVERKPVERRHAESGMQLSVILILDPVGKLLVERFERAQVECAREELIPNRPEKSLHFSLRSAVAHRRVMQQASDSGGDLDDFLGAINRAVIDVERVRDSAFVKRCPHRFNERVHVFRRKELSVSADPGGVVDERNEPGLHRRALDLDIRPKERVGLPHFVGMRLGKGESAFVHRVLFGLEQVVAVNHTPESVRGDLRAGQEPFLDAEPVKQGQSRSFAVDFGINLQERLLNFLDCDLAHLAFVGARLVVHHGDSVLLKT